MLRLDLKFFIRSFNKRKAVFLINIVGLSISIFCLIVTFLWINNELGTDKFHANGSIYKVMQEMPRANGRIDIDNNTSPLLGPALGLENPEVKQITRYAEKFEDSNTIVWKNKKLKVEGAYADPAFFSTFSYPVKERGEENLLHQPNGIVISTQLSQSIFDRYNAIGESVNLKDAEGADMGSFIVTGIVENKAAESSLAFDFLLPFTILEKNHSWINKWGSSCVDTYLTLNEGVNLTQFEARIKDFVHRKQERRKNQLFLYPFEDYYLHSDFSDGKDAATGRIMYVRAFILFGIFILIIGCINYVNLSTAVASERRKEFAMKTILGATRQNIIRYVFSEAFFLTLFATVIALGGVYIFLDYFNTVTGELLAIPWGSPGFVAMLAIVILAVALLSGSYPAVVFSEVAPLQGIQHQKSGAGKSGNLMRNGLVVFQFCLAVLLMVLSQIIETQNDYVINKDLGFNYDHTYEIYLSEQIKDNYEPFRTEVRKLPSIHGVCRADQLPFNIDNTSTDMSWGWKDANEQYSFSLINVDYDFLETFNIPIAAGRTFSRQYRTDSVAYVINRTAAEIIKQEDPLAMVNENVFFWKGKAPVIGVVEDFHHASLYNAIEPLVMMVEPSEAVSAFVKFKTTPSAAEMNELNALLDQFSPGYPLELTYMGNNYRNLYEGDLVAEKLNSLLAIIAIVISVLGLFGLSLYNSRKSEKSIAIRKVLGASASGIFFGLTRKYLIIVSVSFLIAAPVAYHLSRSWLEKFQYQVDLGASIFLNILLIVIGVTFITTAYYTVKAIVKNPVNTLKMND